MTLAKFKEIMSMTTDNQMHSHEIGLRQLKAVQEILPKLVTIAERFLGETDTFIIGDLGDILLELEGKQPHA